MKDQRMVSIKYASAFLLLSALALVPIAQYGGWWWTLLWPAFSMLCVGLAYAGLGPGVFGKRPDGGRLLLATALLLPFLALTYALWHVLRLALREHAWDELTPGVLIGRRLLSEEMPNQVTMVVDLTCEFTEPRVVWMGRAYRCWPILDGGSVDALQLLEFVEQLPTEGCLLIHCAQGHGRTGMVAAALLLARHRAADAAGAIGKVQSCRPGVRLRSEQNAVVQAVEKLVVHHDRGRPFAKD